MILKSRTLRGKLMTVMLVTSGVVLLVTCVSFFAYEFFTFRQTTINQLSTLGKIVATNSTAALAFDDKESATEILSALKAETHVVQAGLYDGQGSLFSVYPAGSKTDGFPRYPGEEQYVFTSTHIAGFQPVELGGKRLGTLYMKSDLGAMNDRLVLYGIIAFCVVTVSFLLAYFLSNNLQRRISVPILALAETAKAISDRKDYSVRASKLENDELGLLTDAFNQMLSQIEEQNSQIMAFNQKLEDTVIERTSQMDKANKELEAFSYSVSHDLRAPLRSIHGYMTIFSEDYSNKVDDEGRRLIGVILKNASRMGQLIDDLLNFSKLGRIELALSRISMNTIVEDVIRELTVHEENESVTFEILPMKPAVADNSMFRQVWTNLISNAIKYSKKKENPKVEIGCYDHQAQTFYYIKDNGAGFDMAHSNKLFGVFQRLHRATDFEGTGVGLALVKRIIQRHGGDIWAEAVVNQGAKFFFTLPRPDGLEQ